MPSRRRCPMPVSLPTGGVARAQRLSKLALRPPANGAAPGRTGRRADPMQGGHGPLAGAARPAERRSLLV